MSLFIYFSICETYCTLSLGVHAALSRRDELQHHRQGGQGDTAYGGQVVRDSERDGVR